MKLSIDHLDIEVTRRCNMRCMHCIRGEAENKDMNFETLKRLLDVTDSIGTINFTGGEPSLNVPLMRQALDYVKEKEIPVYNIFIVTNGKQMTNDFVECYLLWVEYCSCFDYGNEYTNICLSKDIFHEDIPVENERWIKRLPYYSSEKETDFKHSSIFLIGRAEKNEDYFKENGYLIYQRKAKIYDILFESDEDAFYFEDLYLSSDGNICSSYIFSYKDMKQYFIGNVYDISRFFIDLMNAEEDGYIDPKIFGGGKSEESKIYF